ncbi:hypothetical protein BCV70DRAFT_199293 [Testicularia cyperi]|uniref:PAP-associated domain-containing protein n=1 Tax=Testicularia cyperi TaxID=1882483 RepID=A0A317XRD9_9BASI|nr:hypothetical protein BCV70DRAFT_199293 [Testicularia cyperi]
MVFRGHLDADLNVNDRFGLQNSRMIAAYADLQPELVRPLIFFLKHWFKRRGLNDPSGKNGAMSFSSYTIALLAIQYLQVEGVLPNLQDPVLLKHLSVKPQYLWTRARTPRQRREGDIVKTIPSKGYNVTFSPRHHRDLRNTVEKQGIVEGLSNSRDIFDWRLGKLLVGFVRFYLDFPRNRQAVSVANGAPLTLDIDYTIDSVGGSQNGEDSVVSESLRSDASDATQDQDRATDDEDDDTDRDVDSVAADQGILTMHDFRQPADWLADELIVQDPFILDRNTSRNIKLKTIQSWHGELERALLILEGQIGDDTVSTTSKGTLSSSYSDDSRAVDDETPLIADLCVPTSILGTVSERGAQAVRAARFSVQDSLIDLVDARQTEARDAMIKKEEKQANKEKYRKKARRRYRGKNRRDKTDDDNDDKPGTTANDRYGSEPNKQQPPKVWPPADGSTSSRFDFALPSPGRKKQRRPSDNIETVTTRLQKQADIH